MKKSKMLLAGIVSIALPTALYFIYSAIWATKNQDRLAVTGLITIAIAGFSAIGLS
jgi:hypothetical protein